MEKFIEATGKTMEDAITSALQQLNMDRDSVSVEILEKAKSGFLGIGGSPARVKVTYDDGQPEPKPAPAPKTAPLPKAAVPTPRPAAPRASLPLTEPKLQVPPQAAAVPQPRRERRYDKPQVRPDNIEERAVRVSAFLTGLLERMDARATFTLNITDEGFLEYNLAGEKTGMLIGRRGETLDAIQHLVSGIANHGETQSVRVTLDAEGYRRKREVALIDLANHTAAKVVKYHRNIPLEPMNAYSRHVIHTALQDHGQVTTHSVGSDPNRKVVIALKRG